MSALEVRVQGLCERFKKTAAICLYYLPICLPIYLCLFFFVNFALYHRSILSSDLSTFPSVCLSLSVSLQLKVRGGGWRPEEELKQRPLLRTGPRADWSLASRLHPSHTELLTHGRRRYGFLTTFRLEGLCCRPVPYKSAAPATKSSCPCHENSI